MSSYKKKVAQVFDRVVDPTSTTLEFLAPIAKAIPVLGPSVEGAVEAANVILKYSKVSALIYIVRSGYTLSL